MKGLKVKVRRVYSKRKLGQRYELELKRLYKELLAAKKTAQEEFLRSVLRNEGNCCSQFYKYVKKRKGNGEIIPAIKDQNGTNITDTTGKTNIFNSYYASVSCYDRNIREIKLANSGETFIISTKVIRKRKSKIGKSKSVGPDGVPGEILKLSARVMTPSLGRLPEISLSNATIPSDRKKNTFVPIYKGGDRSAVSKNRQISLTSVVYKQMEHIITGYWRQVCDKNNWSYEGEHGFRPGYSCEIQVVTVCQDKADSLDKGSV